MEGFVKGKKLKKMGMKAQDTAELFFEDLRVPASAVRSVFFFSLGGGSIHSLIEGRPNGCCLVLQVLGEVNKGFYAVMQELPQERLLIADIAVASGEAV